VQCTKDAAVRKCALNRWSLAALNLPGLPASLHLRYYFLMAQKIKKSACTEGAAAAEAC